MNRLKKQLQKILNTRQENGRYAAVKETRLKGVFDCRYLPAEHFKDIAPNLNPLIDNAEILKDGGATKVARVSLADCSYVIKRYNWRGWVKGLRYMVKGSRARRVWFYGHLLRAIKVKTPRPLGWLERSEKGIVRESYIITRHLSGQPLYDYICDSRRTETECLHILEKVNKTFKRMHSRGLIHGDLKRSNLFVSGRQIYLIDLDSTMLQILPFIRGIEKKKDIDRFLRYMYKEDVPKDVQKICRRVFSSRE